MNTQARRIPQLDATRGIAILVVMFHNERDALPSHLQAIFASGWMGVDLFFVLSGFLITGILLDAKGSDGFFRNFYARRCLRIWPLYYALILFMFVAVPLLRPAQGAMIFERSSPWWAYPFYLQNFLVPVATKAVGPLGVTWSLAIEEQFYLLWPLAVRYLSRSRLRWVCIAVVLASPLVRLYLSGRDVYLYSNLFCRLDGLMAGAVLATLVREPRFESRRYVNVAWTALIVSLPLALARDGRGEQWIVYSLSVLASAGLVYLALFSTARWLRRVLTSRPLVFTGMISYGLYLLHKIPFDAVKGRSFGQPALVLTLLVAGAYLLATASWYLYERPFLRLKRFFEASGSEGLEKASAVSRARRPSVAR
jgi:peptidoglycan/LPS O-acetylase OafA/YrhL